MREASSLQNTELRSANQVAVDIDLESATQVGSLGAMASAIWSRLWDRRQADAATMKNADGEKSVFFVGDEMSKYSGGHAAEILNAMGDSWETCRPCSDVEMVQTFCSSDIGKRM